MFASLAFVFLFGLMGAAVFEKMKLPRIIGMLLVRPFIRESMPACTSASVRVSMELVASSRISTGGSATAARAMASS